LGPVVADDVDTARRLTTALLARLPDGAVYWDVLPYNVAARGLAESLGFCVERRLIRMHCGAPARSEVLDMVYGAAGFEVG
jgi:RimJ/RimL family protein N-acetyltransferase